MFNILGKVIVGILVCFGLLVVLVGFAIFMDGISKRFVIYDGSMSHYTDSYKEKDGCVYFADNINESYKLCGYYTIRERKFDR